jgi:hypothetical protein
MLRLLLMGTASLPFPAPLRVAYALYHLLGTAMKNSFNSLVSLIFAARSMPRYEEGSATRHHSSSSTRIT